METFQTAIILHGHRRLIFGAVTDRTRSASTRARRTEREGSGIISPTLKRSFEVEETDSSTHPSPLSRRTTNPLRSSTSSTSSQRSYDLSSRNSDYSSSRSSPSESSNPRSPKTGMRRIELTGGRNPDTASSRRTEISIEVSSKQIDNSPSAGIARFGLKRPEVSLSSRSSPLDSSSNSISSSSSSSTNRRAELSMTRPSEPPTPPRRVDAQLSSAPVSRIPEPPQRRAEPPSPILSPVEGASRRPEMPVFRQQDGLVPSSAVENNNHPPPAPSAPLPSLAEPRVERVQSPVTEPPAARPTERPEVISSYSSSAMSEAGGDGYYGVPSSGCPVRGEGRWPRGGFQLCGH
ncbi:Septin-9 [Larimichthys crocea]|uniref:Uncharacterized protein n=1 Tax=Larimichthys crocea TaxID=215358 RepID=A0ACD3R7F8_LARCR|nr:Septin-9 [Larimichthys crocea]